MEIWPIKVLKAAPISRKLEIAQNAKSCVKQKKLLEIRKVAKKLPSNLWQALTKGTVFQPFWSQIGYGFCTPVLNWVCFLEEATVSIFISMVN